MEGVQTSPRELPGGIFGRRRFRRPISHIKLDLALDLLTFASLQALFPRSMRVMLPKQPR